MVPDEMKVEDTEQALTEAVCSRVREQLGSGRCRSRRGIRPPALPLGRGRGRGRARPARPLRARARALQLRPRARSGDPEGARVQPALRGARLAVHPHRRRDRDRRHAVPDRLGEHGAEPARVRGPPDHPPGARRASRRRRRAARDPPPASRRQARGGRAGRVRDPRRGGEADGPGQAARAGAAPGARDRRGARGGRGLGCHAQPGARRGGGAPRRSLTGEQRGRGGDGGLPRVARGAQLHLPRIPRVRRGRPQGPGPRHPARAAGGRGRRPVARAASPHPHEGELARDRPPAVLPRLRGRQALRRGGERDRGAALPRAVHAHGLPREPDRDPDPAAQGRQRSSSARASRTAATTRRRCSRSSTPTRATSCSRS